MPDPFAEDDGPADVPNRRLGAVPARRQHRVPRTPRRSGEGSRRTNRARRGRGRTGQAPRHPGERGGGRQGRPREHAGWSPIVVASDEAAPSTNELRRFLLDQLPAAMVPVGVLLQRRRCHARRAERWTAVRWWRRPEPRRPNATANSSPHARPPRRSWPRSGARYSKWNGLAFMTISSRSAAARPTAWKSPSRPKRRGCR